MAIFNKQLNVSETVICSSGPTETRAVLSVVFCNTTTSSKFITLYTYPNGGSAGDSSTILKNYEIPAEDSFIWTANEKFILGPGDVISGVCSDGSAVTATANYYVM